MGQVGGLAAAGAITHSVLHKQLEAALTGVPDAASLIDRIVNKVNSIEDLKGDLRNAVLEGYNTSLSYCHGKLPFSSVKKVVATDL